MRVVTLKNIVDTDSLNYNLKLLLKLLKLDRIILDSFSMISQHKLDVIYTSLKEFKEGIKIKLNYVDLRSGFELLKDINCDALNFPIFEADTLPQSPQINSLSHLSYFLDDSLNSEETKILFSKFPSLTSLFLDGEKNDLADLNDALYSTVKSNYFDNMQSLRIDRRSDFYEYFCIDDILNLKNLVDFKYILSSTDHYTSKNIKISEAMKSNFVNHAIDFEDIAKKHISKTASSKIVIFLVNKIIRSNFFIEIDFSFHKNCRRDHLREDLNHVNGMQNGRVYIVHSLKEEKPFKTPSFLRKRRKKKV